MGLMNAINRFMHEGSTCPGAGSLGECCGIWLDDSNATHAHYYAAVYLWTAAEGMPYAEVARWFKEAASIDDDAVRVNLIVHDTDNDTREGRCHDGARALGVTFTVPLERAEELGMELPKEPPGPESSPRLSAADLMGARAAAPHLTQQQIEEIAELPVDQLQVRLISALAGKGVAKPAPALLLKGTGKIAGDGWKDTTRIGEVVYAWNREMPEPYKAGQFPRLGNPIYSASTEQYDFTPCSDEEAIAAIDHRIEELRAEVGKLKDARPSWLAIDVDRDELLIHGKRYAASMFGPEGWAAPVGTVLQICESEQGVLALRRIDYEPDPHARWQRALLQMDDCHVADAFLDQVKSAVRVAGEKGRSGWQQADVAELHRGLHKSLAEGYPVDVAAYCMFLWSRGDKTEPAAQPAWKVGPLTPAAAEILGRICFQCIHVAQLLRAIGHEIETRAEAEQAAVIHYLLSFYATHGDGWAAAAEADLKAKAAALAEKGGA